VRRYLVLFRGQGLREYGTGEVRQFYPPRFAMRTAGAGPSHRSAACTTYRSIGECNGAINADLKARRTFDDTATVPDYTIVALEVRP